MKLVDGCQRDRRDRLRFRRSTVANRKERRAAARNKENEGAEAITPDEVLGGGEEGLPAGDAMPFPDHEEDVLFKAQMQVLNVLLGHWKTGLAVVGAVLLGVLVIGEYGAHQVDEQRGFQDQIADIDRRMPDQTPAEILNPSGEGLDPNIKANVEEGARRYEAVAGGASGAAAVMAWLKAGSAWERAGDDAKAKAAYGAAHGVGASDVVGWSAASQFANAQAAAGDPDAAIATLKAVQPRVSGLAAQQVALSIATVLEDAGRKEEGLSAYNAFIEAHPDSVLVEQANDGIRRLGEAG